jgi:hypothetical protein
MYIEAKWNDDRKTVLQITFLKFIPTWADFDAGVDHALRLARSVSHDVTIIVDPRGIPMPKQGSPLKHLRRALVSLPSNVKLVVGILDGLGYFERSLVAIIANVSSRNRLKLVASIEDAYKLIF